MIIIISIIVFILFLTTILILWHNEIKTIFSIKELASNNKNYRDGFIYEMNIYGEYYLDDFLKNGGVKSDKELIEFITKKITKGIFKLKIEETKIGCSSFATSLENSEYIFARNYDMTETNVAIVHTNPKNRFKSISSVDLTFLGIDSNKGINNISSKINTLAAAYTPLDGINEKGVAVGIYMTYQGPNNQDIPTNQIDANKPDITSTILLRLILDYASNVNDAVEIAQKYNMHDSANSSYHYMISDALGNSVILEYLGDKASTDIDGSKRKLKIIYKNDSNSLAKSDKYQIATNFVVYPNYYEEFDKKNGLDRYELIQKQLKESNGKLKNEDEAMKILKSVARRDWIEDDQKFITTHSVIYNNTNKTAYWIGNEHYDDEKYIFNFNLNE